MRKVGIGLIYVTIFAIGFLAAYEGLKLSKIFIKNPIKILPTPNTFTQATPKPLAEIEPVKQDRGTYNVLFLGYGGVGHSGGLLADSIIVAHIDINTKKVLFVSVPRDLWVNGNQKINASGISGFQNVSPVVTSVTGLPINYFIAVNFGGFTKIINDLGGISSEVPNTFDDHFYPITGQENNTCGFTNEQIEALKAKYSGYSLETQFTCRYEHLHFDKGSTSLDGETALKFVRSRHGDSDFGRSLRQFAVLTGIKDKLVSAQGIGKFDSIVGTVSQSVKTDLDAGTIKSILTILGDTKNYTTSSIQLSTDNVLNSSKSSNGQFILVPKAGGFNYADIKSLINSNIK